MRFAFRMLDNVNGPAPYKIVSTENNESFPYTGVWGIYQGGAAPPPSTVREQEKKSATDKAAVETVPPMPSSLRKDDRMLRASALTSIVAQQQHVHVAAVADDPFARVLTARGNTLKPLLPNVEAASPVEPTTVTVGGASGSFASRVNGVYEAVDNLDAVYSKVGNTGSERDIWLFYCPPGEKWFISKTAGKERRLEAKSACYAYSSSETSSSDLASTKGWKVASGSSSVDKCWEEQGLTFVHGGASVVASAETNDSNFTQIDADGVLLLFNIDSNLTMAAGIVFNPTNLHTDIHPSPTYTRYAPSANGTAITCMCLCIKFSCMLLKCRTLFIYHVAPYVYGRVRKDA